MSKGKELVNKLTNECVDVNWEKKGSEGKRTPRPVVKHVERGYEHICAQQMEVMIMKKYFHRNNILPQL